MQRFKTIYIEITNVCNLKCTFCPTVERSSKEMSAETFRSLLPRVAPHTESVALHLMGEPLGHPELKLILAECAERAVPVTLTTNGVRLNASMTEDLLRARALRQVNISLHSYAANLGPTADPSNYLRRVLAFVERMLAERPEVYINLRLWDLTPPTGPTDPTATIVAQLTHSFGALPAPADVNLRRKKSFQIRGRLYLNYDSQFVWPSLQGPALRRQGRCHGLSSHIGIHADGTVVPCCLDKEAVLRLGNALDTPLNEILEGPLATNIREGFAAGELRQDLCQRCDFVTRFRRQSQKKPRAKRLVAKEL